MTRKRNISFLYANNWQGRVGTELLKYLDKQVLKRDVIFGSEVEAQMSGDQIRPQRTQVFAYKQDGQVMVNQANVLMARYSGDFHMEFSGENQRTYHCHTTGLTYESVQYGNIMMVSNRLKRIDIGSVFIFGEFTHRKVGGHSATPRVLQYAVVEKNFTRFIFAHFHGLWIQGNTKGDCLERDTQSENVLCVLEELRKKYQTEKIILGGDFNLDITTRALAKLEAGLCDMPLRNGVRKAGFTGTRTPLYRNYHDPNHSNFADYLLYGGQVSLRSLKLGAANASDHHSLEGLAR